MAKELAPIERQVITPLVNTGNNTAYAQMGESSGKLANILAGKLSEQAVYQSGLAGQKAVEEGRAPKNLSLPLTKATQAYNDAVVKAETRQLINNGRNQLLTAFAEMSNESTFNEQTPALFKARIEGITQGVLEVARPENRGAVNEGLMPLVGQMQFNMLNGAIKYDNKKVADNFKLDLDVAQKALEETLLTKDAAAEKIARENIDLIKQEYGTLSQQIKNQLPDVTRKIEDQAKIASVLGDYLVAQELGEGQKFISNFANSKPEGLTTEQKFTALQKMIANKNLVDSADNERRAQAKQILANDINDPTSPTHINTLEELKDRDAYKVLTPLQQEQIYSSFISAQASENNKAAKIAEALNYIAQGRAGQVDKGLINDIFLTQRGAVEEQIGGQLTLEQQFEIVKGLETNVPKFDQDLSTKLTSMEPGQTAEAGQLYANAVLAGNDNLINLSTEANVMGEKMATLLNGGSLAQKEVVDDTIRRVLKITDPEVAQKNDEATKIISKEGPALFKMVFDRNPDPFMDNGAYNVFKDQFLNAYSRGANAQEAMRIAKRGMREWGASEFFEKGKIEQFAPEKELPLSNGTQNIRNQLLLYVDEIVKANNEGLEPSSGKYKMKLLGPPIPDKIDQYDFVYEPLDGGKPDLAYAGVGGMAPGMEAGPVIIPEVTRPVRVEVNGVKSEVVLKSSRQTKASGPNPSYGVFIKDQYGVYQQMSDPRNADGLAYVSLKDLDQIAPQLFEGEGDKRLMATLNRARGRQLQEAMKFELRQQLHANPWMPAFRNVEFNMKDTTLQELKDAIKNNEE